MNKNKKQILVWSIRIFLIILLTVIIIKKETINNKICSQTIYSELETTDYITGEVIITFKEKINSEIANNVLQ